MIKSTFILEKNILNNFFREIIDFVLPPVCLECEGMLKSDEKYLCQKCTSSIEKIDNSTGIVLNRLHADGLVNNAYSMFLFREGTPIQALIHALKYGQMRRIGKYYGKILGNDFRKTDNSRIDYIIPVPLHISKKRERGYNQSDFICDGISEAVNIQVLKKCLKRTRFTQTQTKLSREERIQNVRGAFKLRKKYVDIIKGKNVIIVDDVITTGSTIIECAKVLKENGCGEISVCSLALAE